MLVFSMHVGVCMCIYTHNPSPTYMHTNVMKIGRARILSDVNNQYTERKIRSVYIDRYLCRVTSR